VFMHKLEPVGQLPVENNDLGQSSQEVGLTFGIICFS